MSSGAYVNCFDKDLYFTSFNWAEKFLIVLYFKFYYELSFSVIIFVVYLEYIDKKIDPIILIVLFCNINLVIIQYWKRKSILFNNILYHTILWINLYCYLNKYEYFYFGDNHSIYDDINDFIKNIVKCLLIYLIEQI